MDRLFLFCFRYAAPLILAVLGTAFWLGSQLDRLEVEVSSEALIPGESNARKEYNQIRAQFGSDEIVTVFVQDETLFTPESLETLAEINRQLSRLPFVQRVESLFSANHIERTPEGLQTGPLFRPNAIPQDPVEIERRRESALGNPLFLRRIINEAGDATAITLFLKSRPDRIPSQGTYFDAIEESIEQVLAPYRDEFASLYQVGAPAIQNAMARFILEDQILLLPLAAAILMLLIALFMQSFLAALLPLLNALVSTAWVLGIMVMLDVPLNILNSIVPAMLLIIGATEDVHFLSEFETERRKGATPTEAVRQTGIRIGLTLVLTGFTTTLGFAATGLGDLDILREFGITAGAAMLARLLLSVTFNPAVLRFLPAAPRHPKRDTRSAHPLAVKGLAKHAHGYAGFILGAVLDRPILVIGTVTAISIPCLFLIPRVHVGNDLVSFLKSDAEIIRQMDQTTSELSGSKVIFLTLHDEPGAFRTPERLRVVRAIQTRLAETGAFQSIASLPDVIALMNREFQSGEDYDFKIPDESALISQYLLLLGPSNLRNLASGDYSKANLILRCNVNDSREFSRLYNQIRYRLDSQEFGALTYSLTGKSILVAEAVDEIVASQVSSLGSVILMLFIVVAFLFVSLKASILAVLANLFPVVVLFAVMAVFEIPLNVGTCMIAAITIGVAVDDTLHLMVRYNRELKRVREERTALHNTLIAEFQPVMTTSIGLVAGFLVLSFSSFIPIRQFGLLSAGVIALAVFTDLLLTPLLLSTTRLITIWDMIGLRVRQTLLERSPLFQGMKPWQAKKLILTATLQEYQPGDYVIRQGDEGDTMYVIIDGRLSVERGAGNTRTPLAELSVGDALGEVALVSKNRRTADVIARTPSKVLALNWDVLLSLQRFAPYLSSRLFLNLSRILGDRMVKSLNKMDTVAPFFPGQENPEDSERSNH